MTLQTFARGRAHRRARIRSRRVRACEDGCQSGAIPNGERMALLWTQKQDVGPAGRLFPVMTFDGARERVVLFGGQAANGDYVADTWSWDGADWTQVSDIGP